MKTLTVGGGGREHAMMLEFAKEGVDQLATQANAGMEELGTNLDISSTTVSDITAAASSREVDFVVVGPEVPLIAGLGDLLRDRGIPVLGFGRQAVQLEGSKAFAVEFAKEFDIVIPDSFITSSLEEANDYINAHLPDEIVIKADGPASGKGVVLPTSRPEALEVSAQMLNGKLFGEAGHRIVFQERLSGPEVSMIVLFDGKKSTVLPMAQDHKRLKNNNQGPNTGGMGAYSPVPTSILSERQTDKMYEALDKTMRGIKKRDIASPGILYLGFMLAERLDDDPALYEYNMRFGDPEAQIILPLLTEAGVNVHELFYTAARGGLEGDRINVIQQFGRAALTVCLAAAGYPGKPRTLDPIPIHGFNKDYRDVVVHHGATKRILSGPNGIFTAAGAGRVLYVTGLGDTIHQAARRAYTAIGQSEDRIHFRDMQYRKDIGRQAINS